MGDFEEEMDAQVKTEPKVTKLKTESGFPMYQWSQFSASGAQYVVRSNDITMFEVGIDNSLDLMKSRDGGAKATPTQTSYKPAYQSKPMPLVCEECEGELLEEKRIVGKDGRAWWVRNCSVDQYHKTKGAVRPAK